MCFKRKASFSRVYDASLNVNLNNVTLFYYTGNNALESIIILRLKFFSRSLIVAFPFPQSNNSWDLREHATDRTQTSG